ncbi:hypothetical protein GW765_04840 [Candidatus Parcubacteria bacterium]|nr:hypothetical protein [Candidatus Parcubacteria bacterium]
MKKDEELIKKLEDELVRVPIVTIACGNVGISRQTYYRWIREDSSIKDRLDKALKLGVASINDLGESKLIELMKNDHFGAVKYWLGNNNGKYLSPKPADVVRKLLNLEEEKITEIITRMVTTREEAVAWEKIDAYKKKYGDINVNLEPNELEQKAIEMELRKLARNNVIEAEKRKNFEESGFDYDKLYPNSKNTDDTENKDNPDIGQESN